MRYLTFVTKHLGNVRLANKRIGATALILLASVMLKSVCYAQSTFTPPLPMNNRTPFTQALISPTPPNYNLGAGDSQFSLRGDLSSHSIIQSRDNIQLELDGETLQISLDVHHRVSDRWLLKLEAPFVMHTSGTLDGFIDRWHRITGLPEGERPRQPRNDLLFGYQDADQFLLIDSQQAALGDIQLSAAYQLSSSATRESSAKDWQTQIWSQATIKLPSGRPNSLTGSGATDASVSLHVAREQLRSNRPWSLSADVYAMWVGNTELINQHESLQWQVGIKLAWRWNTKLTPEVQVRYRSSAYDNPLDALGSDSLGIDVGAVLHSSRGFWRLGLSEDIDVDTAPDVSFYLHYNRKQLRTGI